MSLRARVQRMASHQASTTQRLEVWHQDGTQDAFHCRTLPDLCLTRDELRARREPGLLRIVVQRYAPCADGAS